MVNFTFVCLLFLGLSIPPTDLYLGHALYFYFSVGPDERRCLFTRNFYSVLAREYSYKNTRKQHTHLSTIRFTECNILWIHWFIFTQKESNYIQTKRQTNKAVRMKPNTRHTDLFCGYIYLLSHNKNSISFKRNHKRTETYAGRQIPQH